MLDFGFCFFIPTPRGNGPGAWTEIQKVGTTVADKSGREVALASVYAALERLEQKGFLTSSLGQPTAERGGKARTYFKATPAGIREAREAHATFLRLSAGLPALRGETA